MSEPLARHPGALPPDVAPYRRTPDFTEKTLPAGLRRDHSTKAGVWALIHVLEGRLRYCVPDWNHDVVLEAGQVDIVAPEVLHFVEPAGELRMYVEFYAGPGQQPGDPHGVRQGELPAQG